MVAEAHRRTADSGLPIEFVEGDANALPFEPATFDRTRAERVLMALPDPLSAVRELARVTRPGGIVVLSEMDAGTIFVNSSNRDLTHRVVAGIVGCPAAVHGFRLRDPWESREGYRPMEWPIRRHPTNPWESRGHRPMQWPIGRHRTYPTGLTWWRIQRLSPRDRDHDRHHRNAAGLADQVDSVHPTETEPAHDHVGAERDPQGTGAVGHGRGRRRRQSPTYPSSPLEVGPYRR
ncbi:SAM-dependent methyltransferase [Kribbella aluminosa]|uniref:SAM-dependent methyltransferase n=1 Tax=Kribbella aluminosa TaxID=416017 RepID=A0ABS4UCN5_9ACTN|nr:methyltransferase domain-containing protein [Kribbella aluminosa]MBP2349409.1 SAM-dependent methyltransferase [Kribbella aluminosa]